MYSFYKGMCSIAQEHRDNISEWRLNSDKCCRAKLPGFESQVYVLLHDLLSYFVCLCLSELLCKMMLMIGLIRSL
jgi:hypothetical protein